MQGLALQPDLQQLPAPHFPARVPSTGGTTDAHRSTRIKPGEKERRRKRDRVFCLPSSQRPSYHRFLPNWQRVIASHFLKAVLLCDTRETCRASRDVET